MCNRDLLEITDCGLWLGSLWNFRQRIPCEKFAAGFLISYPQLEVALCASYISEEFNGDSTKCFYSERVAGTEGET